MKEDEVRTFLKNTSLRKLIELFYEAAVDHSYTDEECWHRYVVCKVAGLKEDTPKEFEYSLMCIGDPAKYKSLDQMPDDFCQNGSCCLPTQSFVKHAICPVCQKEVYGT